MVEQQIKMFKLFDQKSIYSLNNIFGEKNIVGFNNSNIVGIKYDYDKNKLKNVMQKVPFTLLQQLIITSQHFVEIIGKIASKGCRPNFTLNMDLPDKELLQLKQYIFKISKQNENKEKFKKHIIDEINRLEEEYDVEIESVSFTFNNNRVVLKNNGIVFLNEDSFNIAREVLCD